MMADTTMAYSHGDPQLRSMAAAVAHSGRAPKRIVTGYGFWIFILSDMVMFSAFFAAYAVLLGQTAGGAQRARTVRPAQRSDRNRLPARLELYLRPRHDRGRYAQCDLVSAGHGRHLRPRPRLSRD